MLTSVKFYCNLDSRINIINISKEIPAFAGFPIKLTSIHTDLWYKLGTVIENLHRLKSVTLSEHYVTKDTKISQTNRLNTEISNYLVDK